MSPLNRQALELILKSQLPDGSFPAFSSSNPTKYHQTATYFYQPLILELLTPLQETYPALKPVLTKLSQFILTQKSSGWTFNYWIRESQESIKSPYPDDLDDSALSWSALLRYRPDIFTGRDLAQCMMTLTTLETQEGGPYRTWFVSADAAPVWQDVDLAVNANVAYFLSSLQVRLDSLDELINSAISQNRLTSPYYLSPAPVIYFISRSYRGQLSRKLERYIHRQLTLQPSIQDQALLSLALLKLNKPLSDPLKSWQTQLSASDRPFTRPMPLVIEKAGKQTTVSGSLAFHAALSLHLLHHTSHPTLTHTLPTKPNRLPQLNRRLNQIIQPHPQPLRQELRQLLKPILDSNQADEIIHLPSHFTHALTGKPLHRNLATHLGLLNLFGWAAYTHFDYLLDKRQPAGSKLIAATTAYRHFTQLLLTVPGSTLAFTRKAFNFLARQENAILQEQTATFTNTSNLKTAKPLLPSWQTDRALGHLVSLLAVLAHNHIRFSSPKARRLIRFFRLYLLTRQLLDDAHDWEEDLRQGNLTPTLALLFQTAPHPTSTAQLKDPEQYRLPFWQDVIPVLMRRVLRLCHRAEQSILLVPLAQKHWFHTLIRSQATIARDTLRQQQLTLEFIQAIS